MFFASLESVFSRTTRTIRYVHACNYCLPKTPCKATPPPSSANSCRPTGKNSGAVTYHSPRICGSSKFLGFEKRFLGEIVCNSRVMFLFRLLSRPKTYKPHHRQADRQKRKSRKITLNASHTTHINERLIGLCEGQSVQLYIPPPVVKLLSSMWRTPARTAALRTETTTREQMEAKLLFIKF